MLRSHLYHSKHMYNTATPSSPADIASTRMLLLSRTRTGRTVAIRESCVTLIVGSNQKDPSLDIRGDSSRRQQ